MKTFKIYKSGIHFRTVEFKTEKEVEIWIKEQMNYHGDWGYTYKEV